MNLKIKTRKIYELLHYGEHYMWCKSLNHCKRNIAEHYELNKNRIKEISEFLDEWEAVEKHVFE